MIENSITLDQTIQKATIRSAFRDSPQVCYSVVNVLVTRFLKSFAFATKLDPSQIEILTVDTLEYFAYESLEDVILFFKMGRTGRLGTAKKGIDSNLIFGEWLPKYLEQKSEARERETSRQKTAHTAIVVDPKKIDEVYQAAAAKKAEEAKVVKVKAYIEKITKDMDRQMLEDTIIDWDKDPLKRPYLDLLKRKRKTIK